MAWWVNLFAGVFCMTVGLYEYEASFIDTLNVSLGVANFVVAIVLGVQNGR